MFNVLLAIIRAIVPMYDLSTKKETQITNGKSNSRYPAIYGNRIVWEDDRNTDCDIYVYDLATHQQTHTTDTSAQYRPNIYGDKIVWEDVRNGNYDIYMGTLSSKTSPVAAFSVSSTSGKAPLNVAFKDKSTESPTSWLHKGNILRRLKKFDEALEAYNKTIDLDTKFIEGYISKGETFSEMKKYNEALAVYEEALKLSPNSINSVFSLIGKGMALNSLERYEEASDSLLKASNIMPDNYLIWLQLSKVFTNFGQYENAVYSLKKSASLIAKFKAS